MTCHLGRHLFLRPPGTVSLQLFPVVLRPHILSVRSPQLRYKVRDTEGTFVKCGLDTHEAQLAVLGTKWDGFNTEPEGISGWPKD
jgi:hypothetical protein